MQALRQKTHNLLRRSERHLKTDVIYLVKGGLWLTLGQAITSISGLILSVVFANFLDPNTYGIYRYFLSFFAILSTSTLIGINSSLTRSISQNVYPNYKSLLYKRFAWGTIGSFVALLIAGYYLAVHHSIEFFVSFAIIALFTPFFESLFLYDAVLQGEKNFKRSTLFTMLTRLVSVVCLSITILLTKNIVLILLAYFIPVTVSRFFIQNLLLKKERFETSNNSSTLSYGKYLSALNVINIISANIDKILVFQYLGPTQLSIYYFSMIVPDQIRSVFKNVGVLAFPKFASREEGDVDNSLPHKIFIFTLVMAVIFVLYFFLSPLLFKLFFPQYLEAIFISQVYAIVLILTPKVFYRVSFEVYGRKKELAFFQTSTALFRIISFFVLLPMWGIWGAIATNIASELFTYATVYTMNSLKKPPKL